MHNYKDRSGLITGVLLPVGLICVFAFCALLMSVLGAQAYKTLQADIDDSFGSSVTANYLRTKLAQNNRSGAVELREDASGVQMLVLHEADGERAYETRIFVYEGYLKEIFLTAGQPFDPANGQKLTALESCRFSLGGDGLLNAEIVSPEGVTTRMSYALVPKEVAE